MAEPTIRPLKERRASKKTITKTSKKGRLTTRPIIRQCKEEED
jgi:hypothetical protein